MGKSDIAVKKWLSNKQRFADLFNGIIFQGQQIVLSEELVPMNAESDIIITDKEGKEKGVQRYRDIVMKWKEDVELAILACENQDKIHYAMPVRFMLYDSLTYTEQVRDLWREEKEKNNKLTEEEFLSGFPMNGKIYPVITLVFYYGEKEWNASKDLYGLFQFNHSLKGYDLLEKYISNYRINLVQPDKLEDLQKFHTDLQLIMGMLKWKKQKEKLVEYIYENAAYFKNVDRETYQAIREMLHSKKQLDRIVNDGEEVVDMCEALQELYDEGVEKGREKGLQEGIQEGIQAFVRLCCDVKLSQEDAAVRLAQEFHVAIEEAHEYVLSYWK